MKSAYNHIQKERNDQPERQTFGAVLDWLQEYESELKENHLKSFILKIYSDIMMRRNYKEFLKEFYEGESYKPLRDFMN